MTEKSVADKLANRKIDKDNFIDFLASATPQELNQMILNEGKPPKLISPIYFFRENYNLDKNGGTNDGK